MMDPWGENTLNHAYNLQKQAFNMAKSASAAKDMWLFFWSVLAGSCTCDALTGLDGNAQTIK